MRLLEVPANRTILLPKHLFKPADKIAVLCEGGIVVIKKIETPRLSSIATRVRERPLSMRDIAREVQAYRKEKRLQ